MYEAPYWVLETKGWTMFTKSSFWILPFQLEEDRQTNTSYQRDKSLWSKGKMDDVIKMHRRTTLARSKEFSLKSWNLKRSDKLNGHNKPTIGGGPGEKHLPRTTGHRQIGAQRWPEEQHPDDVQFCMCKVIAIRTGLCNHVKTSPLVPKRA